MVNNWSKIKWSSVQLNSYCGKISKSKTSIQHSCMKYSKHKNKTKQTNLKPNAHNFNGKVAKMGFAGKNKANHIYSIFLKSSNCFLIIFLKIILCTSVYFLIRAQVWSADIHDKSIAIDCSSFQQMTLTCNISSMFKLKYAKNDKRKNHVVSAFECRSNTNLILNLSARLMYSKSSALQAQHRYFHTFFFCWCGFIQIAKAA